MVEIFSPWRTEKANTVAQTWPYVWKLYNVHTENFIFTIVSDQSCLKAKGYYGIRWMKRGKQVLIAPLCFRRCSNAIVSAAAAAAHGLQGGKQIIIDHKSGPTLRFWRVKRLLSPALCCLSGNNLFFTSLHKPEVDRGVKKEVLFHRAWESAVQGRPFLCCCCFWSS